MLGEPDTSQLSMTEMADFYARLCDASPLPILSDADTGYGGPTNVARTVRAYERAGVAALFVEDQVFPKRCGHMDGKRIVPRAEWLEKIKAALDARTDPDLVIMARTDALAVVGLDEAIERAQMAREVGADLLFVEAPTDVEQMRRICSEIDGPTLANNIEAGKTPYPFDRRIAGDRLRCGGLSVRRDLRRRPCRARPDADLGARRNHRRLRRTDGDLRGIQRYGGLGRYSRQGNGGRRVRQGRCRSNEVRGQGDLQ